MPDLVQKTVTFKNRKRIDLHLDLHEAHPDDDPLIIHLNNTRVFNNRELRYKALFLRTLSRMLAEKQYDISAEQLFSDRYSPLAGMKKIFSIYGSQSLLCVRSFLPDATPTVGKNESTTSYKFDFAFLEPRIENATLKVPIFQLDVKAVNLLREYGVAEETIEAWGNDFLKMAGMAEHDYLHQTIEAYRMYSPIKLLKGVLKTDWQKKLTKGETPDPMTGDYREDHTLSLHAQIVKRLFEEVPRRKTRVLEWAAQAYEDLYTMQEKALATCGDDEGKRHDVNEVITYFAEIYNHRLFRVIAPDDPALRVPPDSKTSKSKMTMGVADAMNKLIIVTPEHMQAPPLNSNLERLTRHCEDWLGKTYKKIHKKDSFVVLINNTPVKVNALEMMHLINKGAVVDARPFSEEFTQEAEARADDMRVANALREEGKRLEERDITRSRQLKGRATRIESNLRKPGFYER